jgi:hypothetical protein
MEIIKLLFEEELVRDYCLKKSLLKNYAYKRACSRLVPEKENTKLLLKKSLLARDCYLKRSLLKTIKSQI